MFDPVGGADFREYLRSLAWNGRYLVVGFAGGEIPQIGLNLVLLKSVSIVGVAYGASARLDPAGNADDVRAAVRAGTTPGCSTPVIGHRFPLERGGDALRVLRDRGALGKVIVEI